MDIDFTAVRKKAKEKYGPKGGEFQKDSIDFQKVRERANEKYGTLAHNKQLDFQNDRPKDMADSSVGTADLSGPPAQPTFSDTVEYQDFTQQSFTPYLPGLQDSIGKTTPKGGDEVIEPYRGRRTTVNWEEDWTKRVPKAAVPVIEKEKKRQEEYGRLATMDMDSAQEELARLQEQLGLDEQEREKAAVKQDRQDTVLRIPGEVEAASERYDATAESIQAVKERIGYLESKQEYERLSGLDIQGARTELEEAERRLAEAEEERNSAAARSREKDTELRHPGFQSEAEAAQEKYDQIKENIAALQRDIEGAERINRFKYYSKLTQRPDFAEKSKYVPKEEEPEMDVWQTFITGLADEQAPIVWKSSGWEDPFYAWVNGDKEAGAFLKSQDNTYGASGDKFGHFIDSAIGGSPETKQMTRDEVAIFNYLYATEGKEAAYRYYGDLQSDLYRRNRKAEETQAAAYAHEHPFKASAATIIESPLKVATYAFQAVDYLTTGKIDQNEPINRFSYLTTAVREQVSQDVERKWGGYRKLCLPDGNEHGGLSL